MDDDMKNQDVQEEQQMNQMKHLNNQRSLQKTPNQQKK